MASSGFASLVHRGGDQKTCMRKGGGARRGGWGRKEVSVEVVGGECLGGDGGGWGNAGGGDAKGKARR